MPADAEDPPQYTRYRARRRLLPRDRDGGGGAGADLGESRLTAGARAPRRPRTGPGDGWRRWTSPRRLIPMALAALVSWVSLSVLLFLLSSHFERTPLPADVAGTLAAAGSPLTSANTILVLGSDRRQRNSREPGAERTGFGRSDTIMLLRVGGGHSARLSIPRDTVVEIPGHGLQKINAAHAIGGPAESVRVIEHWLGIPINHVVEVDFENFPQLIDAMGGVQYKSGCVVSRLDGGFIRGGYTLRLRPGTHHLDGKQALALARTRENLCAPNENDLQREEHQQALLTAMKSQLLSFGSFVRLPWIAWSAPPAIGSDMSGPTLLSLFASLGIAGTPPTHIMRPTGTITLADGEQGLTVSEGSRRAAVARFLSG
jgi:LCP family protein required for cell wall assembly